MTSTVWTTIVAISAIGLAASPISSPRPASETAVPLVVGGPPDTLVANPAASSIRWKGTGFGGRGTSEGAVKLASGLFVIRHEKLTSGTFTIDMRSIEVGDTPATEPLPRRGLRDQLRSAEFFDVARYPTAVFRSTGARRIGPARWQVTGNLTMRGVTKPVTLDTDVRWAEVGHMIATSAFTIDRQRWGVAYRGSQFADDLVGDDIQLSLTLDAHRKQASVATR